jgi:DnaJ domain
MAESVRMAAVGDPRGYYRALGVDRTASAQDIKAAFRLRAKDLHPDRGAPEGEREAFRLLLEAYEALRDPQQRMRYDAAGLAGERQSAAPAGESDAVEAGPWDLWSVLLRRRVELLAGALLVVTLLAVLGWARAVERGRALDEATRALEALRTAPPVAAPPAGPDPVLRVDLQFPDGVGDLDPMVRSRLADATAALRREIATLPPDGAWLVAVDGLIARAADRSGLLVDAWELTRLRVGVATQYLVAHGIPAERVAVRFHAGAAGPGQRSPPAQGITLSLLCCDEDAAPP